MTLPLKRTETYMLQGLTVVTQYKTRNGDEQKNLYSLSKNGRTLSEVDGPTLSLKK